MTEGCEQLSALREQVDCGPTVLTVEEETAILERLQSLPYAEVVRCSRDFDEITSALYMSHMDTYFAVNDSNIAPYLRFAAWLDGLGDFVGGEARRSLRDLAEHFRANSKDFKIRPAVVDG